MPGQRLHAAQERGLARLPGPVVHRRLLCVAPSRAFGCSVRRVVSVMRTTSDRCRPDTPSPHHSPLIDPSQPIAASAEKRPGPVAATAIAAASITERELEAACGVPEAVLPVDRPDRVQHHDRDAEGGQRRQQPDGEEQAARLREGGEQSPSTAAAGKPSLRNICSIALQARAVEPAEQLLHPVPRHRRADRRCGATRFRMPSNHLLARATSRARREENASLHRAEPRTRHRHGDHRRRRRARRRR